jgi:hypothetical protein
LDFGLGIVACFGLGGRDIPDGFEQAAGVEPVDPFEGGELDGLERPPRPPPMDHLSLEQAVDRLGQSIVVAVADAADGWLDTGLGEPLGVAQSKVLRAPVAGMHEAAALEGTALVQGLLQSVEHEGGIGGSGDPPTDDAAGEDVDHESDHCRSQTKSRRR